MKNHCANLDSNTNDRKNEQERHHVLSSLAGDSTRSAGYLEAAEAAR